jgi:hypothetical protein
VALLSNQGDQKVLSTSLYLVATSVSPQEQSNSTNIRHMLTFEKFAFREWMNRLYGVIQNKGKDDLK